MRKKELALSVAKATGLTAKDCLKAIDMAFRMIVAVTDRGEPVVLTGFGIFERKTMGNKRCTLNGKDVTLPLREKLRFRAAKKLTTKIEGDDTPKTD